MNYTRNYLILEIAEAIHRCNVLLNECAGTGVSEFNIELEAFTIHYNELIPKLKQFSQKPTSDSMIKERIMALPHFKSYRNRYSHISKAGIIRMLIRFYRGDKIKFRIRDIAARLSTLKMLLENSY